MIMDDVYERITAILSLFLADSVITIKEIEKKTAMPIQAIRDDICALAKHSVFHDCFDIDGQSFDEELLNLMRRGAKDDAEIYFYPSYLTNGKEKYLIPLERIEYPHIEKWFNPIKPFFRIKTTFLSKDEKIESNIKKLDECIYKQTLINFAYGKQHIHNWKPVKIWISSDIFEAVCIGENKDFYYIGEMTEICDTGIEKKITDEKIIDELEAAWGLPTEELEKSFKVELHLFPKNHKNIYEKLENDTTRRTKGELKEGTNSKLYGGETYYIYKDTVNGKEYFQRWVMGYGSLLKVVKPKWLAKEIAEKFRIIKEQTEKGMFI